MPGAGRFPPAAPDPTLTIIQPVWPHDSKDGTPLDRGRTLRFSSYSRRWPGSALSSKGLRTPPGLQLWAGCRRGTREYGRLRQTKIGPASDIVTPLRLPGRSRDRPHRGGVREHAQGLDGGSPCEQLTHITNTLGNGVPVVASDPRVVPDRAASTRAVSCGLFGQGSNSKVPFHAPLSASPDPRRDK